MRVKIFVDFWNFQLARPLRSRAPPPGTMAWGPVQIDGIDGRVRPKGRIHRGAKLHMVVRSAALEPGTEDNRPDSGIESADGWGLASSTRCCRPRGIFTTSKPCRRRHRSRFTCWPTTRRASGGTSSIQTRGPDSVQIWLLEREVRECAGAIVRSCVRECDRAMVRRLVRWLKPDPNE